MIKNSEPSTGRCMLLLAPTVALVFVYPISSSLSHCLLLIFLYSARRLISSCQQLFKRIEKIYFHKLFAFLNFRFLRRYGEESRSVAFWRPDGMWESQILNRRQTLASTFHCTSINWSVCFVYLFVCLFVCLFVFFLFVDYEETLLTLSVTEASALNFADVWGGTQTPETGLGAPCCAMQRFQLGI